MQKSMGRSAVAHGAHANLSLVFIIRFTFQRKFLYCRLILLFYPHFFGLMIFFFFVVLIFNTINKEKQSFPRHVLFFCNSTYSCFVRFYFSRVFCHKAPPFPHFFLSLSIAAQMPLNIGDSLAPGRRSPRRDSLLFWDSFKFSNVSAVKRCCVTV